MTLTQDGGGDEDYDEISTSSELLERNELESLEKEFRWVIDHEVSQVFKSLSQILKDCDSMVNSSGNVVSKFVLTSPCTTPSDEVKVMVTLCGDSLVNADINLKLPRQQSNKDLYTNTSIREDAPWRLHQIQDARNHLGMANALIQNLIHHQDNLTFKSLQEINYYITAFMGYFQRSRSALINPKKRTLEELQKNKNVKGFNPSVPNELALSFYIQSFKLIFAVYHISTEKGVTKFNRYQAECVIPWINDLLLLLTDGLQTAQQLKDKLHVFTQYPDFNCTEAFAATNNPVES